MWCAGLRVLDLRLTGGPWAGQLTSPDLGDVVSKTVPATAQLTSEPWGGSLEKAVKGLVS